MSQQFYVIRKQDGDLEHKKANTKYLDKFWKNGKWNYIYKDAKKAISKGIGLDARKAYKKAQSKKDIADLRYVAELVNRDSNYELAKENHGKLDTYDLAKIQKRQAQLDKALKNKSKAEVTVNKAKKAYHKTALGKLDKAGEKISYGAEKVAKILDKKRQEKAAKKIVSDAQKKLKGESTTELTKKQEKAAKKIVSDAQKKLKGESTTDTPKKKKKKKKSFKQWYKETVVGEPGKVTTTASSSMIGYK